MVKKQYKFSVAIGFMEYEGLLNNIITKSGASKQDIEKRIIEKQQELSNLISKEGAAYIIAKEMGLDIFPKVDRRLEIQNVVPLIRDLKLSARVVNVSDVKEFESKGRRGKVASVILGDSTGTIRMSLWDEQTELTEKLEPGMAIETFGAYTRDNKMGGVEVRLGKKGGLKILEESNLPKLEDLQKSSDARTVRRRISDIREGDNVELRASVVQLFENKLFFDVCPKCGKSVKKDNDYKCAEHGKVEPKKNVVLLGVIDDGTGNLRAVFFRDTALDLLGMKMEEVLEKQNSLFEDLKILGKEYIMVGKMRKNRMFDRMEFIANHVREIDAVHEANKILNDLA